jgi:hypothetical protein
MTDAQASLQCPIRFALRAGSKVLHSNNPPSVEPASDNTMEARNCGAKRLFMEMIILSQDRKSGFSNLRTISQNGAADVCRDGEGMQCMFDCGAPHRPFCLLLQ